MKCLFTLTIATLFALSMTATSWSQAGGGAGGASGGAGAGGASGSAGTSGSAGAGTSTAGTAGTTGTAGVGTTGTATRAGAASTQAGITTGPTGTAGATGAVGVGTTGSRTGANTRLNAAGTFQPNPFSPNFVSPTPFFSDPNVQRQLGLNAGQFNTLNTAYGNAYARYNQALNSLNANTSLTPQQRAAAMQQLQTQFNTSFNTSLNTAFTNPQMRTRYDQLNRQFMGFNAFLDPAIRRQLNLTTGQLDQLRTLSRDFRQQLQELRRGMGNNINNLSASDQARWDQVWNQYMTQINTVLSPEQQQVYARVIGQPFTFSPGVFSNIQAGNGVSGTGVSGTVAPVLPPDFVPANGTGRTATQGTQTTGQRQATFQGSGATQGPGGTVR